MDIVANRVPIPFSRIFMFTMEQKLSGSLEFVQNMSLRINEKMVDFQVPLTFSTSLYRSSFRYSVELSMPSISAAFDFFPCA